MIIEKYDNYVLKNNTLMDCIGLRKYIEEGNLSIEYIMPIKEVANNTVLELILKKYAFNKGEDSKYFKISMFYVNGIWYADRDDEGDYILKEVDKNYEVKR